MARKCAVLWCDFGVMFDFGFVKMFSADISETYCYFHDSYIKMAATDYYMYFILNI